MYRGTKAELRPIATPARNLPATMRFRLVAVADSRGPTSMGRAHSMKDRRRPRDSAKPPPVKLPSAAPASVLLTTCRDDGLNLIRGLLVRWLFQQLPG